MDEFLTLVFRKHQISEISFTKLLAHYTKKGINIEKMTKNSKCHKIVPPKVIGQDFFFCDTRDIEE
jgi:hypothetical protein